MIKTYKILSWKYDTPQVVVTRDYICITRGNDLTLKKVDVKCDSHKYYFTNRAILSDTVTNESTSARILKIG